MTVEKPNLFYEEPSDADFWAEFGLWAFFLLAVGFLCGILVTTYFFENQPREYRVSYSFPSGGEDIRWKIYYYPDGNMTCCGVQCDPWWQDFEDKNSYLIWTDFERCST